MDFPPLIIDDPDQTETFHLIQEPVINTCVKLNTGNPLSQILNQASGAVESNDLSLIDDGNTVTEVLGFLDMMGGVQDRDPGLIQGMDTFKNRISTLWIDADRRLIKNKNFRLMEKPDRNIESSLHSVGKGRHGLVGTIC